MATKQKARRLFKVASEFNVSTSSIVDSLSDAGFEVKNRPTAKVTSEMYQALNEIYGDDKAKSAEHRKSKEEYESRRSQIRASHNERVSVDDILKPLEDEDADEEPSETIGGLAPKDEEKAPEPDLEPEDNSQGDTGAEEEEDAVEPEEEPETATEQESEDAQQQVEVEEETKAEDQQTEEHEAAPAKTEEAEIQEDKPAADKEAEDQPDKSDKEKKEEEEQQETATENDQQDADSQKDVTKKESEKGVIRGKAGRLKGTKVLGKVKIDESKPKHRKKRKRKKDRKNDKSSKSKGKSKSKSKKKSKKKRKSSGKRVNDNQVEQNLKKTMQEMQSSETVGSRRQKRRQQRREEREGAQGQQEGPEEAGIIEATEFITVSDLADRMNVQSNQVITTCMGLGMMVSINQRLDASTIELVAEEFGYEVLFVDADEAIEEIELEPDDPEDLRPRAPIITVMGHVDHGKTSLLDYIRKAQVAEGEAGGITQHVGAYEVETDDGRPITFLDTPGHEAFTAMRSRGAQVTDIVILVVAADDAVMPQTIEAINHAQAADVSIVVAINKMDKPGAKPDKIKQQLAEQDVIVEEYGGDAQSAEVSAKTGDGISDLLEKVLIEAELMELQANPDRDADGVVLESRVDVGKGNVANILVQNGSLKVGDAFVAGPCFGRVRAMENEFGNRIEVAGPSEPLQLTGFGDLPQAGDKLVVLEEQKAKEIASNRQQVRREQELRQSKHLSLDNLSRQLALGEVDDLNIIIKADVEGSIEALSGALQELSNEEVSVNVIHTGAGAITESDVMLASASNAIIIGFQVRPTSNARGVAEEEEIDIRLFSVIYDAVDAVKDAMEGMLSPEITEQFSGNAEVREIFKVSSIGTIAGCYVTDGNVKRNNPIRVVRDGVVIYDGEIDSLKRFKEDVNEVQTGYECGLSIVDYNDLKVDDVIENYEVVEEKRRLEDVGSSE